MINIETNNRLIRAKANKEKTIANILAKEEKNGRVITYSKRDFNINTISSIIPLARKKADSISYSIDYMEYIRKKPENESIVISFARPRKIISIPSETVENIIVKGVSVPLKSYSSSSITKLLSNFLNGFDFLMSQSLSLILGLLINFGTELHKYKKKGSSTKYFQTVAFFLIFQFVVTLVLTALVGTKYGGKLAAITAILCTAIFFIARNVLKFIQKKKDIKTGLLIDNYFENELYIRVRNKLEIENNF